MKIVLNNADVLIRKITALGNRPAQAAAAEAVGEYIRKHMIRNHLSGQDLKRDSGDLQESFQTVSFTTPYPGATLYSDLRYAKILNYDKRAARAGKTKWFERSITETRAKHAEVAAKAWERERGK